MGLQDTPERKFRGARSFKWYRDIIRCVNHAALIDQIQQARDTLERQTCETAGKSGKQIERCVMASFQVAESLGYTNIGLCRKAFQLKAQSLPLPNWEALDERWWLA